MADPTLTRMSVALATAVIYDHITTLDQEIELVWRRSRFSMVQCLFFVARYVGDFVPIHAATLALSLRSNQPDFTQSCMKHMKIQTWSNLAVVWAMEGIMIFRISVMYKHSRKVIALLIGAFILEVASLVFIQVYGLRTDTSIGTISTRMRFCAVDYPADWYFLIWVPIITSQILLLLCVSWKGLEHLHYCETLKRTCTPRRSTSLSRILFRDSILFPLAAVIVCVANFVGWLLLPLGYSQIGVSISAFAARFLGCRLVLNLREVYYHPFEEECTPGATVPIAFVNNTDIETNVSGNDSTPISAGP